MTVENVSIGLSRKGSEHRSKPEREGGKLTVTEVLGCHAVVSCLTV